MGIAPSENATSKSAFGEAKIMIDCPCGAGISFAACCGRYLSGEDIPSLPELLMRSRYTAYSMANVDYIEQTMRGKALVGFDKEAARSWAKHVTWISLQVLDTTIAHASCGFVEFIATYMDGNVKRVIHERSEFHFDAGRWFYVDGHLPKRKGRNTLCFCGSGKKFKHCHG